MAKTRDTFADDLFGPLVKILVCFIDRFTVDSTATTATKQMSNNHINYFIGLADPHAVGIAIAALDAVQLVGMPESDVIIAQAAVYLARAPKSREVIGAILFSA